MDKENIATLEQIFYILNMYTFGLGFDKVQFIINCRANTKEII